MDRGSDGAEGGETPCRGERLLLVQPFPPAFPVQAAEPSALPGHGYGNDRPRLPAEHVHLRRAAASTLPLHAARRVTKNEIWCRKPVSVWGKLGFLRLEIKNKDRDLFFYYVSGVSVGGKKRSILFNRFKKCLFYLKKKKKVPCLSKYVLMKKMSTGPYATRSLVRPWRKPCQRNSGAEGDSPRPTAPRQKDALTPEPEALDGGLRPAPSPQETRIRRFVS